MKYVGFVATALVRTNTHTFGGILLFVNDVTLVAPIVPVTDVPPVTNIVAPAVIFKLSFQ